MPLQDHRYIKSSGARSALAILIVAISAAAGASLQAATFYVDGNCPSSGSGSSIACGSTGPKKTIEEGVSLLRAGDTLEIRGVHAAHNGETGSFDGRYHQREYAFSIAGTVTSPVRIRSYQYTGKGTGEKVFLDGTRPPSSGWTKCTDCTTGICAGVPAAGCSQTWYASDNGTAPSGFQSGAADKVLWAQKDDGSITYAVQSPSDLTNAHANYNPKRCSMDLWKPCTVDHECAAGQTCTGTSAEVDHYSPENGGPILVRWGTNLPSKPYVAYNYGGVGFALKSSSAYLIMEGLNFRAHRSASLYIDPGSNNHVIRDNRFFYDRCETGQGFGYGIVAYSPTNLTVEDNEFAYTVDEGIHAEAKPNDAPTVITIRGNWVHNQGDTSVLGHAVGTPTGITLGMNNNNIQPGGGGSGNWAGSLIANNFVANQKNNPGYGSPGYGMRLENTTANWVIRDNVFLTPNRDCIILDGSDGLSHDNQIYNNMFIGCGDTGIEIFCSVGMTNSRIYNNTFVEMGGAAIDAGASNGNCVGNEFKNNIMYRTNSEALIRWPIPGVFQNNLVYSPGGGTLVSFNGRSFTCSGLVSTADIDGDGSGNDQVRCQDPLFMATAGRDYHLRSGSPAVDAGTFTGLPAGRTSSINNTLASSHGLPSYADNISLNGSSWDIGATEGIGGAVTASIQLSDPSPTTAGTVTVTLTTSLAVVNIPVGLTLTESDSSTKSIILSGSVPGTSFAGTLVVDTTVADGMATFSLPLNSLLSTTGLSGNTIALGRQVMIDKTPPAAPVNVRVDP